MQILIDIPEEKYELYKRWKPSERSMLQEAVANGIPLLERHGALKDTDALIEQFKKERPLSIEIPLWKINEAHTIIPTMKGDANENN